MDKQDNKQPNWAAALEQVDKMDALCSKGRKQVKELLQALSGEEKPQQQELIWEPKKKEQYFYCAEEGGVSAHDNCWDATDVKHFASYNYYQYETDANADAKWFRVLRKLRHLARLSGNMPAFDDLEECWYILYDGNTDDWVIGDAQIPTEDVWDFGILFRSKEAAQTAIDNLTDYEKEILKTGGYTKELQNNGSPARRVPMKPIDC